MLVCCFEDLIMPRVQRRNCRHDRCGIVGFDEGFFVQRNCKLSQDGRRRGPRLLRNNTNGVHLKISILHRDA